MFVLKVMYPWALPSLLSLIFIFLLTSLGTQVLVIESTCWCSKVWQTFFFLLPLPTSVCLGLYSLLCSLFYKLAFCVHVSISTDISQLPVRYYILSLHYVFIFSNSYCLRNSAHRSDPRNHTCTAVVNFLSLFAWVINNINNVTKRRHCCYWTHFKECALSV